MSFVIALDGPAGSGKGTVTNIISERLGLMNIESGAMYRCVALKCIEENVSLDEKDKIIEISKRVKIEFDNDKNVFLDGVNVTKRIRDKDVSGIVSPLSSIVEVREELVNQMRKLAEGNNVIMEGRDITTVVFPNADYKFYIDASLEERVQRRYKQNIESGIDMSYEEVKDSIIKRDYNDMHKEVGALKRTDDQIYIDTTNMTIDEVVEEILKNIEGV